MDVQMPIAPTAVSGTTGSSTSTGKAAAGSGAGDAFTQLLEGQLGQQAPADNADPTDPALSLAGLLQMLQSFIMPMQNAAAPVDEQSTEQSLPDTLLQAMNSNPSFTEKLLQDPKMKMWLEQAEQFLSAMTASSINPGVALPVNNGTPALNTEALQAQNTLLTLASLSKQQPDNPIFQYLNQELQKVVETNLPAITGEQKAQATEVEAESVETGELAALTEAPTARVAPHRADHKRAAASKNGEIKPLNVVQAEQPVKSKLELLAVKHVLNSSAIQSQQPADDQVDEQLPVAPEANEVSTPFVNIADIHKPQPNVAPVEKAASATLNAANFADEMTDHVMKNIKITLADGISEAKLSLFPKNLGHVDVKLTMHEGQLIAQFATDTAAGKQMLESQLPQLRQALQTQGLQVEKLEVTQNQSMQSSMFQDQRHQQSSNQTFRQNKNRSGNYEKDAVDFNQEIASANPTRAAVYGNSFDVIA